VYIETGIIQAALKKKTPFFYKTEIFAEGKIGKCIINEQQAKDGYRHPE